MNGVDDVRRMRRLISGVDAAVVVLTCCRCASARFLDFSNDYDGTCVRASGFVQFVGKFPRASMQSSKT